MDIENPPDSPSALLERAAELIEQRATAFRSPEYWDREVRGADLSEAGAAWVKLFGPLSAQPLVEWLRHASLAYRMDGDSSQDERALAFARQILGEHP